MAASRKRSAYDSETDSNSSYDENYDYEYCPDGRYSKSTNGKKSIPNNLVNIQRDRLPTRVPKVFNRNAVMARENRIKKKQYVDDLEKDADRLRDQNTKLNSIMDNQSFVIAELRKELKYVKAILANSDDIAQLLATIQRNTGMSVSSSLLGPIKSNCIPKTEICNNEKHPWEDTSYPSFPTPDSQDDMFKLDIPFSDSELINLPLSDDFPLLECEQTSLREPSNSNTHLMEHNYTSSDYYNTKDDDDDSEQTGICLHVSNRRVSLEFCSTCNSNATNNWNRISDD